jgi:tRNA modification GTPase
MNTDTIFALSSGFGKSGVAVIRISGNNLHGFFEHITKRKTFDARHAYFCNLTDENGDLIDQCIVIYFAAPNSFTGTDVIEIHSHGAPAVVNKIFAFLSAQNMRMAIPGEFSRRAFLNGKMDLSDVDGLAALLDAQTDKQRQFALKSMLGADSKIYDAWRQQMVEIAAYAAAILDYDADDLPANIGDKIISKTRELYNKINTSLSRYNISRAITHGFNIVLVGETNVGKSSIFNKLVGSNRAIVSDIAGTTRDVISAQIDIDGYLVNLSDTAGLRDTDDKIEKIGIDRTKYELENADLVLHIFCDNTDIATDNKTIIVINKSDKIKTRKNKNAIYTSAETGDGIDTLLSVIREKMHSTLDNTENTLVLNARTHKLLTDTKYELEHAIEKFDGNYDIFAEHVRTAADNIGKILGTITANDIMDATFSQLCLGK